MVPCAVGIGILATCVVLFVQCRSIVKDNDPAENLFAQAMLADALKSLMVPGSGGVTQAELGRALYTRVSLYALVGVTFVVVGWWPQFRPRSAETTSESN